MKKNLIALSLILILALSLCICAFAAEGSVEMRYVVDTYGLLSFDQWASLENQAANISEQHGCGIYIVTVDDYRNYGDGSVYDVTTQIYHRSGAGFGMGSGRDGIMLLLSMNRNSSSAAGRCAPRAMSWRTPFCAAMLIPMATAIPTITTKFCAMCIICMQSAS